MCQQSYLWHIQAIFFQGLYLRKNFFRCSFHHYMTIIHNHNPVCINDFLHVMCDQNDRNIFLPVQLMNCLQNFFSSIRIQHGSRLIQNDTLWAHRHYSGDRNPLLLTSGQFVR